MSKNFSWFLRVVLYIPLCLVALFMAAYSTFSSSFDSNMQTCLQEVPNVIGNPDRKQIVPLVGCLKKKSNYFLSKAMKEERLYQYAYPKLPCYFIGKWYMSSGYKEYWLTIEPDASYRLEQLQYQTNLQQKLTFIHSGVWSNENDRVIRFMDNAQLWPIHDSKLRWSDSKHFILYDDLDEPSYFFRHTELAPDCKFQ
ncbi:hypothetical protein [Agitococcus lubricus]|uniref:Uncharacterized protein n=1 Tax=Agitococcus lubricus TaxID=1077255 RepID=A0A2T5J1M5_9GAMM|nr:hypothetical protein [Agitococcus lubricus]PTQ90298.1 hypothetical protein C8N29_10351 [Agitococcus lubricus]